MARVKLTCKNQALKTLLRFDQTEKMLREKLEKKEYTTEEINETIVYLIKLNYINDLRFAENYIRLNSNAKGKNRLKQDLYLKGIYENTFNEAYSNVIEDEEIDTLEVVKNLILKKTKGKTELDQKEFRRVINFCGTRGFGYNDTKKAMEELNISVDYNNEY